MNVSEEERALKEAIAAALEGVGADTGQAIAALKQRAIRNRRMIQWLTGLSVIVGGAVGVLIYLVLALSANTTATENVQQRTSDSVLCPLYELFIEASKFPPPPNYNTEQLKAREQWFVQIREGHALLGCEDPR